MNKWYDFQCSLFPGSATYKRLPVNENTQQVLHVIHDKYINGNYQSQSEPAFEPHRYIKALKGAYPGVSEQDLRDMILESDVPDLVALPSGEVITLDELAIKGLQTYLGLNVQIKFHCQHPGQIFPLHFDRPKYENNKIKNERRAIIFLTEWKDGQVVQLGSEFIKWTPFIEMYAWDHVNVKHGSANFGYEDRLAPIITWKEDLTVQGK